MGPNVQLKHGCCHVYNQGSPAAGMWCIPNRNIYVFQRTFTSIFVFYPHGNLLSRAGRYHSCWCVGKMTDNSIQQRGFVCYIHLLELTVIFQGKNSSDVRMTSPSVQRKTAHKRQSSVIDLREDQTKAMQDAAFVCSMRSGFFTPCNLHVPCFYASFLEIPWNWVVLRPYILRANPGDKRHSGHFGDGLLNGAKLRVKIEWAQVAVHLSVCGLVPQIRRSHCSRW